VLACEAADWLAGREKRLVPEDEPVEIEFSTCHYPARCRVRACRAKATIVTRAVDAAGPPIRQYELCAPHADQSQRENAPKAARS
jgi:hypothetical protein